MIRCNTDVALLRSFGEGNFTIAHEDYLTLGLEIKCGVDGVEKRRTHTDTCKDKINSMGLSQFKYLEGTVMDPTPKMKISTPKIL